MYDLIIIGAGPAGLTACLYALRFGFNVLLLDQAQIGGELLNINNLENYPGFSEHGRGLELAHKITQQLKELDFNFKQSQVKSIQPDEQSSWKVITDKKAYLAKSLIIATGSRPKSLNIKGESEFRGKGVSYCAVCDAPFFKNKVVMVVGGGNKALEEAIFLTKFAKTVMIVHRGNEYRADKIIQERLKNNSKIIQILNSQVTEIMGKSVVEAVKVQDKQSREKEIFMQGVFIFAGIHPETDFANNLIAKDKSGFLITDNQFTTSQKGVFACGDCRMNILKQVITACSEGAQAAFSVKNFLEAQKK
ncbi:MAG: thioredoxin-disulfide reductase [Candidatus Omnitrophota bacterium]